MNMMKTKLTMIICAVCMLGCCATAFAQGKYTLKGTIRNADGQKVYLRYGTFEEFTLDSATVKKGKFTFSGLMDRPYASGLLYMGRLEGRNPNYVRFSLEPTKMTADIDANDFQSAVFHGGKTQEEENALNAQTAEANEKLKQLNDAYYKANDEKEREALRAQMEPYTRVASEARNNFIKTHPDSYLTPQFLRYTMGRMSYQELKQVYDGLSDDVKQYGDCEEIVKELTALERVQPGKQAPDFTANDINGKPFTMSSLKGHVVIADFWASWCKPCRASNPHMLEIYKKYRIKGLEMVYVSDDDSNEKAWRKAVEQDKLTGEGFHHVLRGLKWDRSKGPQGIDHTNDISDKYAIHYLPTKYLIDQQGRIVCKIESDEQLERELERLLGKAEYPFTINGNVANAEGKEVLLVYGHGRDMKRERTTVKDGRFQFKGVMDNPYYSGTLVLGEWDPRKGGDRCEIALEEGTLTVDAPGGKLAQATLSGGKAQADLNDYQALLKPITDPLMAMNDQYNNARTEKQRNALRQKMEPLRQQYGELSSNYTLTHPDSYLSVHNLRMDMGRMSFDDLKKAYYGLSERVRLYGDSREIEKEIDVRGKTQPGAEAPDFTTTDVNGKPFSLSSLKGKVVILDFWASWCVPCRKSNPHVRALYDKYHAKGLDIVYVASDDGREDVWRKAIADDQLVGEGYHHVLRGFDRNLIGKDNPNDISDKYAIHYIPTKFLIDREGKIVCRIDEGQDELLDQKLAELLK